MKGPYPPARSTSAPVRRLSALSALDAAAIAALEDAAESTMVQTARTELLVEGQPVRAALLLVEGWAARVRYLKDGRRQILSFLLPGDLIGLCDHSRALAASTIVALTDVRTCYAPSGDISPSLRQAYAVSRAIEDACLLAQITRLGRMTALEGFCDLLLELYERLGLAGHVQDDGFDFPLTQETMADVLGLTAVHLNRIAQQARHAGWLNWRARHLTINDPAALAARFGRVPIRVQAS